jgi:hypothetical protein
MNTNGGIITSTINPFQTHTSILTSNDADDADDDSENDITKI